MHEKNVSIVSIMCKITELLFAGIFLKVLVLHVGVFSCWLPVFMNKSKLGFCFGWKSKDLEMYPLTVE